MKFPNVGLLTHLLEQTPANLRSAAQVVEDANQAIARFDPTAPLAKELDQPRIDRHVRLAHNALKSADQAQSDVRYLNDGFMVTDEYHALRPGTGSSTCPVA